jgi:hypothetical protein
VCCSPSQHDVSHGQLALLLLPKWVAMQRLLCLLAASAAPALATASDLDIRIESSGQTSITVSPGQSISFDVIGELTDATNEGLALFSIDLTLPGATLTPVSTPATAAMMNFASPLGMTNPAGFGGTQNGASLKQVGGMQNTFKNSFAPQPSGTVIPGIAQLGSPEVLAQGSFNAPTVSGSYSLSASNVLANVIRAGESGAPTWLCDAAGTGSIAGLDVNVESLSQDVSSLALGAGGTINFSLDGGLMSAGDIYFLVGSASGTTPGFVIDGLLIDLNYDSFTSYMITHPNAAPYAGTMGVLDGFGLGAASVSTPPGAAPSLAGSTLHHAFVVIEPSGVVSLTSNATSLDLLP